MIKIGDYAKQNGVSYEAVRQQLKRYENELKDHIHTDHKVKYLDEVAVDFLNEKRKANPVVVESGARAEEVEELKAQIESLKTANSALSVELANAYKKLDSKNEVIIALQQDKVMLLEDKNKGLLKRIKEAFTGKENKKADENTAEKGSSETEAE